MIKITLDLRTGTIGTRGPPLNKKNENLLLVESEKQNKKRLTCGRVLAQH